MKKVDKYKLRDALEHALFLINQEESEPETFNWWDDASVICEINGYRWYLGQEAYEEMTWREAVQWCKSAGGELPPREVLLMAYTNKYIRQLFKPEYYWSSTEFNTTGAWLQGFGNGGQDSGNKLSHYYVRAVKRVKV